MRLEEYLNEGRSVHVWKDDAKMFLKKHYNPNLTPIYRGVEDLNDYECYIIEPAKFNRESRNTLNHYTLLMDNLPSWKNYPKRSKSIICTTDYNGTTNYGRRFRVIPETSSMIGICSKGDLWFSFPKIPFETMNDFNFFLEKIWDISKESSSFETYGNLVEHFKLLDNYIEGSYEEGFYWLESEEENKDLSRAEIKEMARDGVVDIITSDFGYNHPGLKILENIIIRVIDDENSSQDVIEEIMDPISNGFKVLNAGKFNVSGDKEVWTSGKSLLVPENIMDSMLEV